MQPRQHAGAKIRIVLKAMILCVFISWSTSALPIAHEQLAPDTRKALEDLEEEVRRRQEDKKAQVRQIIQNTFERLAYFPNWIRLVLLADDARALENHICWVLDMKPDPHKPLTRDSIFKRVETLQEMMTGSVDPANESRARAILEGFRNSLSPFFQPDGTFRENLLVAAQRAEDPLDQVRLNAPVYFKKSPTEIPVLKPRAGILQQIGKKSVSEVLIEYRGPFVIYTAQGAIPRMLVQKEGDDFFILVIQPDQSFLKRGISKFVRWGRQSDESNDLVLSSPDVSRRHGVITLEDRQPGDFLRIQDVGSKVGIAIELETPEHREELLRVKMSYRTLTLDDKEEFSKMVDGWRNSSLALQESFRPEELRERVEILLRYIAIYEKMNLLNEVQVKAYQTQVETWKKLVLESWKNKMVEDWREQTNLNLQSAADPAVLVDLLREAKNSLRPYQEEGVITPAKAETYCNEAREVAINHAWQLAYKDFSEVNRPINVGELESRWTGLFFELEQGKRSKDEILAEIRNEPFYEEALRRTEKLTARIPGRPASKESIPPSRLGLPHSEALVEARATERSL